MTLIAPSILSADFARLGEEVNAIEKAGADWVHVDVMDGQFVPNLTIGPPVVRALKPITKLPLDVHLMIVQPENWIEAFAQAGASVITVHQEACTHLQRTLQLIRSFGVKAGVSLNPATSEETLRYVLDDLDLVLVMSVNPGFGGQSFLPSQLEKIARIKDMLASAGNTDCHIQVDGGVKPANAAQCVAAGADVLVAGSAVFKGDYGENIKNLRQGPTV